MFGAVFPWKFRVEGHDSIVQSPQGYSTLAGNTTVPVVVMPTTVMQKTTTKRNTGFIQKCWLPWSTVRILLC